MAQSMHELLVNNGPIEYDANKRYEQKGATVSGYHVKSELRVAIYPKNDKAWMLGMHRCENNSPWTSEEKQLFNIIGRRISDGLNAILLIQELQKTNRTLKESEDRFAKIFDASPVGIMIVTHDKLDILNANKSLCDITGFCKDNLLGKSLLNEELFIAQQSLRVIGTIQKVEFFNNLDIRFKTAQNEVRIGRLSSQSVIIGDRQCIIITIEDVTEYKKAQNEKLAAQKHAAEQEKYALIGQVAGKMAHDFNNILGAIMGNTELSLLDCKEPETQKTLELILEQTKRGRNLTKNLVIFAKDQEPRQDFFSINEKVLLVLNLLKKDLEGISITTSLSEPMPDLLADPGMIENALVNIVHNAIHAVSKTNKPQLELLTYKQENHIVIEVVDNGCGIPKEHEKSIYAPAFTLKNSKNITGAYDTSIKGTGYGLFNVKKIIEKHKGRIKFKTRVNKGTIFYISFPIIKKDLTQKEKKEIGRSIRYTGKRILIVEDEQSIAQVQYYMLTSEPFFHHVDIAHNGHMARDLFERNDYDLISLDYRLPGGLSGMDLYNQIRSKNKKVPILFISGNIEFLESLSDLLEKDIHLDYLSKPCQNKEYVDGINRLFE